MDNEWFCSICPVKIVDRWHLGCIGRVAFEIYKKLYIILYSGHAIMVGFCILESNMTVFWCVLVHSSQRPSRRWLVAHTCWLYFAQKLALCLFTDFSLVPLSPFGYYISITKTRDRENIVIDHNGNLLQYIN